MVFPLSLHAFRRACGLCLVLAVAGCAASRQAEVPPDEQFGHRPGDEADGRAIAVLTPADSLTRYFYYPALFDTVHVRPAPFDPARPADAQAVEVELLVKGALPDACSELHDVSQERAGHLIDVTLEMRRPQGAVCASVVRPYRFYLMLEGAYGPGAYTLKLNGRVLPFVVRAPEQGA